MSFFSTVDAKPIGGKPPKWMVKIRENAMKMDDLGGVNTPIFGNTQIVPRPFCLH